MPSQVERVAEGKLGRRHHVAERGVGGLEGGEVVNGRLVVHVVGEREWWEWYREKEERETKKYHFLFIFIFL